MFEVASEFRYLVGYSSDESLFNLSIRGDCRYACGDGACEKSRSIHYGICNCGWSSIARGTDSGTFTHADLRLGCFNKGFHTQVTVLIDGSQIGRN